MFELSLLDQKNSHIEFCRKIVMKAIRTISTFLGFSMFMFGILKLVNPFKGWYSVQIMNSGMNESLYWPGIIGEISVGLLFIGSGLFRKRLSKQVFSGTTIAASAIVIMIMVTAIRVHMHSNVPADVLPLKIKPPFIPGFFLFLAVADILLTLRIALRKVIRIGQNLPFYF
jgi:hypothetical protein